MGNGVRGWLLEEAPGICRGVVVGRGGDSRGRDCDGVTHGGWWMAHGFLKYLDRFS